MYSNSSVDNGLRSYRSIERLGLIGGSFDIPLGDLLTEFEKTKSGLKRSTKLFYKTWIKNLTDFFRPETRVSSILPYEAVEFARHCDKRLSPASVSRGIRGCKTIFLYAKEKGYIEKNPFDDIKTAGEINESRRFHVSRDIVTKMLDACRNDKERLLIALGRYAGLRIPSEIKDLTYGDLVDRRIRIHADTKTGARVVPMFCEVAEIFDRLAGCPNEKIFDFDVRDNSKAHKIIVRIIKKSGLDKIPKPFINMRSTLITELEARGYSESVLDAFFGNSAEVRKKHYIQFEKNKEFEKMLRDNSELVKFLSDNSGGEKTSEHEINVQNLLAYIKNLVTRFDTSKHDTQLDD